MKYIKYILFLLTIVAFGSCNLFEETGLDENANGNNFVEFESSSRVFSAIAQTGEYTFEIKVKLSGPTSMDETGDLDVSILVNDSTTAIENTHYRIENTSLTLSKDSSYLATFEVVMITAGMVAPMAVDPKLILDIGVTGGDKVVASGKSLVITIVYGCLSHMEGDYHATTNYAYAKDLIEWDETWTKTGIEEYRTGRVGHWDPPLGGGTQGYTFLNKCGKISIESQNLIDLYGNQVYGSGTYFEADEIAPGVPSVDSAHIEYHINSDGKWHRIYKVDYVRIP